MRTMCLSVAKRAAPRFFVAKRAAPRLVLGLGVLLFSATGCQKDKPPATEVHVIPEYKSASEALKKQLPLQPGVPGAAGARALQRELENTERQQDRHYRKAEAAGSE